MKKSAWKYMKVFTSKQVFTSTFYYCFWLWDNVSRYRWSIKIGSFKKRQSESFTIKASEHIPVRFALVVHEGIGHENGYFSDIEEDCLDVFVQKLNEILTDFANFEREMEMLMIDEQKRKYRETRVCYLRDK